MSPIAKAIDRRGRLQNLLKWSIFLPLSLFVFYGLTGTRDWSTWTLVFFVIAAPLLGMFIRRGPRQKVGWSEYWNAFAKQNFFRPFILSMSSRMDEAWQLLHHMRDIPNPLAPNLDSSRTSGKVVKHTFKGVARWSVFKERHYFQRNLWL